MSATAVAVAKPSIAVLGLEVIDKSGTPTAVDTQVAQELTTGLRSRAKAGAGTYQLAPNSEKELIDEKLLKNCDDENEKCMASIGGSLGADMLMYGRIEKKGGAYNVSVLVLDVRRKAKDKITIELIPIAESSGAALQGWSKKIYGKLTGQPEGCTIVVKTPGGPDRATILIGSDEKGNITNGVGQVGGLPEGRYTIAVEAKDYRRWESTNVTCSAGQTQTISADMVKSGAGETGTGPGGTGTGSGSGENHEITGSISHPDKGPWKSVAVGGAVVTGVMLVGFGVSWKVSADTGRATASMDNPNPGRFEYGGNCHRDPSTGTVTPGSFGCQHGDFLLGARWVTGIAAVVAGGVTLFSLVKTVSGSSSTEHASNSHRVKKPDLVVTPIISPNGAGATLQIDW